MSQITLIDKNGVKHVLLKKYIKYSDFLKGANEGNEDEEFEVKINCETNFVEIILNFFQMYDKYLIDERLDEMEEIEKPLKSGDWKESVPEEFYNFVNEHKLTHEDILMPLLGDVTYLGISPLIEILSSKMASLIRGLSKEEMLTKLKITEEDIERANAEDLNDDFEKEEDNVGNVIKDEVKEDKEVVEDEVKEEDDDEVDDVE